MAALSARSAWAVGDKSDAPLIMHWNGTAWTIVKSPTGWTGYSGYWRAVAALSANRVWAVTSSPCPGCDNTQGGIYRWNGSAWKLAGRTGAPSPTSAGGLLAVAASSASSAWAVGLTDSPMIMHWNGTAWKIVSKPAGAGSLAGVAAVSSRDAWAFAPILTGLRPRQQPHPPILIGGQGSTGIAHTVQYGDA